MAIKPSDQYDSTPNVAPTVSAPSDYITTRSNPDQMGAQIGDAVQGVGKALGQGGNELMDVAIQRQGMINETLSTDAETAASAQYGTIMGKYKSLEGLAAVHAVPQVTEDIIKVRQSIRATLPNPAAQRSFDLLAARREGYALSDVNSYGAQQIKIADKNSANAALNVSVDNVNDPSVAFNDSQFNDEYANIKFQMPRMLNGLGYGEEAGTGMKQDKNGDLSFNDTPEGRMADAVYKNQMNAVADKVWTNRIQTQAYDPKQGNINTAIQTLDQNKDRIPSATYAKLSHQLAPAWRNEQARSQADQFISDADGEWSDTTGQAQDVSEKITSLFPGSTITSTVRTPEHNAEVGGVSNSMHLSGNAIDFIAPKGTTLDQVKTQLLSAGIKATELLDEGDHFHVGLGQKGIPVPGIDNSVASNYTSKADYYGANFPSLIEKADVRGKELFPNDSATQDAYLSHVKQQINNTISQSNAAKVADQHLILGALNGPNGQVITQENQLMSDPKLKDAWIRMQVQDPLGAEGVKKVVTANSAGVAIGYGTDFYKHLTDTLSGRVTDPTSLTTAIVPDAAGHSPLTNTGFKQLSGMIDSQKTPEGVAFGHAMQKYLSDLHSKFTGSGQIPGVSATQSDANFDKVLMDVLPKIQAGRAKGLSAGQLFDPKSSDYVTTGVPTPTTAQIMSRITAAAMSQAGTNTGTNYTSLTDLQAAVKGKKIPRAQAEALALKNGWIQNNPPPVPFNPGGQ